jgi:hypothetical protein
LTYGFYYQSLKLTSKGFFLTSALQVSELYILVLCFCNSHENLWLLELPRISYTIITEFFNWDICVYFYYTLTCVTTVIHLHQIKNKNNKWMGLHARPRKIKHASQCDKMLQGFSLVSNGPVVNRRVGVLARNWHFGLQPPLKK